ncbi:potassium channel subfamily K member 1-like [Notothenia coriiceps]|uniref:Potassium channel subfamily K member 1-like n=1 Tax=Notothenia coriiceps TaxID=8208 RepID=A0A6I9Q3H2_9TELE|nr:PREDICTED: potassium channel subfamily K member 1-like [Notothenia coriiceps]
MARLLSSLALFCRVQAFPCLLLCYLLFILLGGLVFWVVEGPVEQQLRVEVEELRRSFLQENPCVRGGRLVELLDRALSAHQRDVAVLKADAGDRGYDFTSSLYFVIVTLTTMGKIQPPCSPLPLFLSGSDYYTPTSDEAKLFCIFYCTLGIPLTLLILTLLSHLLLPVVTHAPVHLLQRVWGLSSSRAAGVHAELLSVGVLCLLFPLPALLVCMVEPAWSFLDALFFCFLILSTVGYGGDSLGRGWGPTAKETLQLLTTCYLLGGLVVIITLKDTLLQVPRVCAVIRLFSGPQYAELEGLHLSELTLSEELCEEEEAQYSQSICTVSSTPLELMSPPAVTQKEP